MYSTFRIGFALVVAVALTPRLSSAQLELGGFVEAALGVRTAAIPSERNPLGPWLPLDSDFTLRETRLQLRGDAYREAAEAHFRVDIVHDDLSGDGTRVEAREAYLKLDLGSHVEMRAGRQPTTWGTGDLLFVNDLFPKDYVSFFAGREDQYLKLPSNAIRLGIFTRIGSIDLVYTPIFEPDRVADPDRLTMFPRLIGVAAPDDELENGEVALRIHRLAGAYEIAAYGYRGFWKDPRGLGLPPQEAIGVVGVHSPLRVAGLSIRGPFAGGVGWLEAGYYHSSSGADLDLRAFGERFTTQRPPSDVRGLIGQEFTLARDWTVGGQAYREHRRDDVEQSLVSYLYGVRVPDLRDDRVVYTLRLTKLLRYQTVRMSLFGFYSSSDEDGYVRLSGSYAVSDAVEAVLGTNVFAGDDPTTPFGANDPNDNVYARLRFSF